MADDFSQYSDEELARIAGIDTAPQQDYSAYSDEELANIAGMTATQPDQNQPMNVGNAAIAGFEQGVNPFSDEMRAFGAGMGSYIRGGDYTQAYNQRLDQLRGIINQAYKDQPYAYGAGNLTGMVAGPSVATPKAIAQGLGRYAAKGIPQSIGVSTGLGSVSGGLYGAGGSEKPISERGSETASGMLYGGAAGAVGSVAFPLAAKALRLFSKPAVDATKGLVNKVNPPAPVPPSAIKQEVLSVAEKPDEATFIPSAFSKVEKALKKDWGDKYDDLLNAYKQGDISLSELAKKKTESLAESAALFPTGREISEYSLNKMKSGAYDRVMDSVRKNISGIENYYTTVDDLYSAGQQRAKPIYKEAFDKNKVMRSNRLDNILATPDGTAALKTVSRYFQDQLKMMAKPDPELTSLVKDLVSAEKMVEQKGGVAAGLKLQTLDAIKKEIDGKVRAFKKAALVGGGDAEQKYRALETLRSNLVDEIDTLDNTGLYKKARETAGDYIKIDNAIENGKKFLNVDAEKTALEFSALTQAEKNAYKIGVGKSIRDTLNKAKEGTNPYNLIIGSPEKQNRLKSVLSPIEYKNLENDLLAEKKLFDFSNKVLSGSPTARREELKSLIQDGAINTIANVKMSTFQTALKTATNWMSDKTAAKVSEILYETDPKKKLLILENLSGAKNFTNQEKQIIRESYAILSQKYDALRAISPVEGALSGGAIGGAISNEGNK